MPNLVLVRHGKTEWSNQNRFAGWADVPLSDAGRTEAQGAGRAVAAAGLAFDACFTSFLGRAEETLSIMRAAIGESTGPTTRAWQLNERHYGALQGQNRARAAIEFGNAQVAAWRRSFTAIPPPLADGDPRLPALDPLYAGIEHRLLPRTESLELAADRVAIWWRETLAPRLRAGDNVLVVAHTSSIRGLVREIEGLDGAAAAAFRIATAVPLVYRLDDRLETVARETLAADWGGRLRQFVNRHKPGSLISWV
jgi:2,3-bisphosphoglycerate-dependent phosphoglycerate mutase